MKSVPKYFKLANKKMIIIYYIIQGSSWGQTKKSVVRGMDKKQVLPQWAYKLKLRQMERSGNWNYVGRYIGNYL